jgi:Glycosyltransferase family 28 C-terminal domain
MCPILLAGWRHIAPLNPRAMMRCSPTRSPNVLPDRDNHFEVRAVPLRTAVDTTAASIAEITCKTLGLRGGRRTPDPWPDICAADVVITHAGQSCVADVAAARRPAIVLPQPRPFDEQHATAETLRRDRLAVATRGWPDARAWRYFIGHARAADPSRWERRQTTDAAARAAEAIETTVCQYACRACHEDRVNHHGPRPGPTLTPTTRRDQPQRKASRYTRHRRDR